VRSLVASLWHETRGCFERLPVWLPGTPMDLGDVGVFDDAGWVKHTTLAALGIGFVPDVAGAPVDFNYSSHDGAQVSTWLAASGDPTGSGIVEGNAGLRIRFSRPGAFVLKANAVRVDRIANLADVDRRILARHAGGTWPTEWVLVSEVARGGPAVTVVSGSREGEAFVDLGAAVAPAGQPLVDAGAGLGIGSTRGLAASFASPTETTLLWRGRCVHDRWWSSAARLGDARGTPSDADADPGDPAPRIVEVEHPEDLAPA
jgi:hypothetical protein